MSVDVLAVMDGDAIRSRAWAAHVEDASTTKRIFERSEAARVAVAELIEALESLLGPDDDPNIGWRGSAASRPSLFECELCSVEHLDCTKIAHAPDCQIAKARAALRAVKGESNVGLNLENPSNHMRVWADNLLAELAKESK